MLRMNLNIVFLVLMLLFGSAVFPQVIYKSRRGTVSVTTTYLGNLLTAHSKQVEIDLNFETSSFTIMLAPEDLHVGIDSLDELLRGQITPIVLKGHLKPEGIYTTPHPPKIFQLNGILELEPNRKIEVKGEGRLEHINGGEELACGLAFYFDTDARSLGLHQVSGSSENTHPVKIQFFETVLRKTY